MYTKPYSREMKLAAIALLIQNEFDFTRTLLELGYPSHYQLRVWYKTYLANGCDFPDSGGYDKYPLEEKKRAVDHFLSTGKSLTYTTNELGYPAAHTLRRWVNELTSEPNYNSKRPHKRTCLKEKKEAVILYLANAESAFSIARRLGVSVGSFYAWLHQFLGRKGCPLNKRREDMSIEELEKYAESLQAELERLELKVEVMKRTAEILGKGRSADPKLMTNKEKTILVESMRPAHKLKDLLKEVGLAKSSYLYQKGIWSHPDKYEDLRVHIVEIFNENKGRYGYRRINAVLRSEGKRVSEKVVCRLMREEDLIAKRPKRRTYSSYQGEIGDAPENIVKRRFHADVPNKLWLTDITEFSIPAGKVYLSPIIDCFDGACISWASSSSPNANLVNTMLDKAAEKLSEGEHPISHTDRGCHYRWPGWIKRCKKYGITRSMSKKGCSPDNSAMEGFFGRLKVEFFYGRDWKGCTIEKFIDALDEYIDWYNNKRIKMSLGGLSPMQYRKSLGLVA